MDKDVAAHIAGLLSSLVMEKEVENNLKAIEMLGTKCVFTPEQLEYVVNVAGRIR